MICTLYLLCFLLGYLAWSSSSLCSPLIISELYVLFQFLNDHPYSLYMATNCKFITVYYLYSCPTQDKKLWHNFLSSVLPSLKLDKLIFWSFHLILSIFTISIFNFFFFWLKFLFHPTVFSIFTFFPLQNNTFFSALREIFFFFNWR